MLHSLTLQNFRNYKKASFHFHDITLLVGPNTAGKTNLIESIFLLSTGKSFRTSSDYEMISFGQDVARVKSDELDIVLANQESRFLKKYLVNGVSKRRADFAGHLPAVLFTPLDLELITEGPSIRRRYLDFVLEQTDLEYRHSLASYEKALRSRNRLLEEAKKVRRKNQQLFEYWDILLIENGAVITKKREEYLLFINSCTKDVFDFAAVYERSIMSKQRLAQYDVAEVEAGMTLVGPHRDDIVFHMFAEHDRSARTIADFGSRGQQRLAVLQLKMIELAFLEQNLGEKPLLLLDDIFSELDKAHISLVLEMIGQQQTVLTTTHREFIDPKILKKSHVIELGK